MPLNDPITLVHLLSGDHNDDRKATLGRLECSKILLVSVKSFLRKTLKYIYEYILENYPTLLFFAKT